MSLEWLHPDFWRLRNAVIDELGGRGQALAVATPSGPAVLRRYHRGGQVARISRDHYLFTGYERSRGFREWRVLQALHQQGLPVPRPIMAGCERRRLVYRAALLTELIPETRSLAQAAATMDDDDWRQLGHTLDAFFQAGMVHADLNAHNVLIDTSGHCYVIDFDRARIAGRPSDPEPMLRRLFRSFDKLGIDAERDVLTRVGL